MSKVFSTCEFCNRVCDFKIPASAVTRSQKDFINEVYTQLISGKFDTALEMTIEKAANLLKRPTSIMDMDQRGIAYCLIAHIVSDLDIKEDIKLNMMKSVKQNSLDSLKKSANIPIQKDESNLEDDKNSMQKESDQEKLRKEREQLREQMGKSKPKSKYSSEEPSDADKIGREIFNWLANDSKLRKIIKPEGIKHVQNGFMVTFDPESEGYLSNFKLQYAEKEFLSGDQTISITKLRFLASYDVKYNMDVAIGFGKKSIVATSFYALPKDTNEIIGTLINTSKKNIAEWDALMLILNNDKKLQKSISKMPLNTPYEQFVEKIKIPIFITHQENKMNLICTTFFDSNKKASIIILDVLEALAEDIDNLLDIDESQRTQKAADTGLFEFNAPETKSDGFHFLVKSEPIEVKTCPNCGRPFPDPLAEYRRCPHCLFKLM